MDKKRLYILVGVGVAVLLGVICFFAFNKTDTVALEGENIDRTEWIGPSTEDLKILKADALSIFDKGEPEKLNSGTELEF